MTADNSIVPYLFLITFVLAIVFGLWQYNRSRKAKQEHHKSVDAKVHGDMPGTPPSVAASPTHTAATRTGHSGR